MRRKKCHLTRLTAACLSAFAAMGCQAQAQSTSGPAGQEQIDQALPKIAVRAKRESGPSDLPSSYAGGQVARGARLGMLGNQDVMDTPFSVSSYTADLIANQQAATLQDVLANDASVRTDVRGRGTQNGGGDIFSIRGFTMTNRDAALNGLFGVLPYGAISMETVERVEVFKGPNALLNGMAPSGGVGGGINVVPKRAQDVPLARFTTSYSSDRQMGGHLDLGRRFGERHEFGVRFNGAYRKGDTATKGQNIELGVVAFGVDYRADKGRVSADFGYQDDRTQAPTPFFELGSSDVSRIPKAPDASSRMAQSWAYNNSNDRYLAISGEYDLLRNVTLHGALGQRRHEHGLLRSINYLIDNSGSIEAVPQYYPESSDTKTYQAGVRATFGVGSVLHAINLGISSLRTSSRFGYSQWQFYTSSLQAISPIVAPKFPDAEPGGFTDLRLASRSQLDSIALSDTVSFYEDRAHLTLGLRHQNVKEDGYDAFGGSGDVNSSYDKSAVTPAIGFLFKPWQGVSLYANYIEALTKGSIAPADAENANEIFPPTKTKQKEFGLKRDFGSTTASLSLFEITQPNLITVPGGAANRYIYKLDGEQRNRGIELTAFGELTRNLRLLGGITYLRAEQTKTQDGVNNGRDVVGVSRQMANLGMEWDGFFAPGLTFTARLTTTGKQYADPSNTLSLASWTRWDAGLRYKTAAFGRPLTLRANLINLANRSYWESVSPTTGLRISQPRTVGLSATVDL